MNYLPRLIDADMARALKIFGAVVVEGPKWCGKTASASTAANSVVRFDTDINARMLAASSSDLLIEGAHPRLFDEWQLAPEIWNRVRSAVDAGAAPGSFLFTGSAASNVESDRHTGTGRFHFLRMRPMSLRELGLSDGTASLSQLVEGTKISSKSSRLPLPRLFELICSGGWPELTTVSPDIAMKRVRSYVKALTNRDLVEIASGRSPVLARKVLKSLARNTATEVKFATLARDISSAGAPIKDETVAGYLSLFDRMMVTEDLEPWSVKMRSSARVRSSVKRFFCDPSIPAALLLATPEKLLKDLETAGLLFENLVIRDLRTYAQHIDAEIFHYRDSSGLEVDAVIQHFDGAWGAIEIKLNDKSVDEAAAQLIKFSETIDLNHNQPPSYLAVVTNTEYSYQRPDGVHVISITALGA